MVHSGHFDLESYIQGKLSTEENEEIISHLVDCDHCLEVVENIWRRHTGGVENAPQLSSERANRLEKRLFMEIHRGDLFAEAIRFAVVGFGEVLKALLVPLTDKTNPTDQEKKK